MGKKLPIFYSALLLTGVNLLLRFISTSFQVYLSGKIGATGIGLLQLVLSVGALAMTAGMGGIRTATMYLSAEILGQKKQQSMAWVLSGCILYSVILSVSIGGILYSAAPIIAEKWIGNSKTISAIRLLAGFLPVNCLCGVMIGYFTGTNRISTLVTVEVIEQFLTMPTTIILINTWAKSDPEKAGMAVIMGSGIGACFTLVTLALLKSKDSISKSSKMSIKKRLLAIAVPLAIADDVKAGINTAENLLVPKRLAMYPHADAPLAQFGTVCGMVFPVLMFPAAILFGLAELLIPEIARCNAMGSAKRIQYLTQKSIKITVIYGMFFSGILYLSADALCNRLYGSKTASEYLRWFSLLAPMLYCDAIVDAINKGLGKQKISVIFNIITSALDVGLLFILLPKYGMMGYGISFLITHLLNFILSMRLLRKSTGKILNARDSVFCIASGIISILLFKNLHQNGFLFYSVTYFSLITILNVINKSDLIWFQGLLHKEKKNASLHK